MAVSSAEKSSLASYPSEFPEVFIREDIGEETDPATAGEFSEEVSIEIAEDATSEILEIPSEGEADVETDSETAAAGFTVEVSIRILESISSEGTSSETFEVFIRN